ncbi:MAG: ATP-binding cassette domain-containing protein [Planctomycetia bacterium]
MPLVALSDVTLAYGGPSILDRVALSIDEGERVGLLGRNASGKSTLMGVLEGLIPCDSGTVSRRQGARITSLPQAVPRGMKGSVQALVEGGAPAGEEAWRTRERVSRLLDGLRLDPLQDLSTLSAGLARRALLARALAADPDLLLLDEPTNHLDLPTIDWLEQHLLARRGALLFVTHDRAFLARLCTRILELDRGRLTSWPGDWAAYLRRQEERALAEERQRAQADKKLAQEEAWIRTGLKAQRKRSEARVLELERLREERRQRRDPTGQVRLSIQEAERSGQLVLQARGLSAGHPGRPCVEGLDLTLLRGDRVGLLGRNGSGKTTLLRTLLGDLEPLAGSVRRGANLAVTWFDPLNAGLDPEKTVMDSVTDGATFVEVGGRRKHVIGYLAEFLFPADRVRQPVKNLSGGERNRLLLARLFAQPSNLLVLDEPTNDLDAETLDLLEDALLSFPGTLLVVSHDRDFLDQVVTGMLVFRGDGNVREVVGGYRDWCTQGGRIEDLLEPRMRAPASGAHAPGDGTADRASTTATRPSGRERREVERLERKIEALEEEQRQLQAQMEAPEFWTGPAGPRESAQARLAEVARTLEATFARWTELQG